MENSNHLTESWSLPWQSVLSSQLWRLEHLYWIENKAGQLQRFSLNRAQRRLHERLWYRNDILKARQLGISTYVAMLMLDMSLFRSNFRAVPGSWVGFWKRWGMRMLRNDGGGTEGRLWDAS